MGDSFDLSGTFPGTVNIKPTIIPPSPPAPPPYVPPSLPDPGERVRPGPLPPGSRLPFARNALFTGREGELRALARAMLHAPAGPALVTQAIAGMGGVGKTQLAVELCYRYGRFAHGVHWINAARPEGIAAEVAACGREMGLPGFPEALPDQVALTLRAWATPGARLVVLDNLEDGAAAAEWLARLAVGGVRLLVTARRRDWPPTLGLAPLPLPLFTPEESRELLRETVSTARASDAELDGLAERLGRLPLALELARRYLADVRRLPVAAYLERLGAVLADPAMDAWRTDLGSPTGHDLSLAATLAVSWERVTDPGARRVFALAACCAPNVPIPCAVLERAAGLEAAECDAAVGRLVGLGLLEGDDERPEAGPTIHPLLAELGRTEEGQAGRAEGGGAGTAPAALAEALAGLSYEALDTGLPARFAPLRAHVEAAAGHAEAAGLERAATLWNNLGYHRKTVADYAGARAAFERALRLDEAAFGPDHPEVATDVNNLGNVLRDLGDLAGARAAFERALRLDEAAFGPDHPNVAIRVNNLGLVLRDLGDLAGARAAFERALRLDEAAFGPDHPNVATDVNNLGSVLRDLGDLAGARAAFERALRLDEAAFGPDHPNVATDVNNLGNVLRDLGDLAGARAAFERALRIDEKVYGPDHPNVARDVNNLGGVLRDLGDLAGARAAYERALRLDEAAFGPDHPEVATDVNNLGNVLQALGDPAGARAAFERALRIWEQMLGPEHPQVATGVNNLGLVLRDLGDLAGARAAFERALRMREQALGREHPDTALSLWWLGTLAAQTGDRDQARVYLQETLRIFEKTFPPGHPRIEAVRGNLEGLGGG